jgi:CRP-like cAMP-binding protein
MAGLNASAKRDVLAATDLFAGLARDDLDALAAIATERRVARDSVVVRRGDTDASLLVLVSGRLRVSAVSSDGREVTLRVMEAGTFLGEIALLDGRSRSADVAAMTDSVLLVVERAAFLPFLSVRPELMLRLMALLCDRLRRSSSAFEDVALASLSSRLAKLLLDLAAQHGRPVPEGVRIRLKLSQKELSAQVAATRERVNKQLRQWHEQGLLGEQDGDMVVREVEKLRALIA